MAINFPSSPTVGQEFVFDSVTYRFNGLTWVGYSGLSSGTQIIYSNDWLTYSSALSNDALTYTLSVSGAGSNDYVTYHAAVNKSNANDLATYSAAISFAQSNDLTTYTAAQSNDWTTYVAASGFNRLLVAGQANVESSIQNKEFTVAVDGSLKATTNATTRTLTLSSPNLLLTGTFPGQFTQQVGTTRYYPATNIRLSQVYSSLGIATNANNVRVDVKVDGSSILNNTYPVIEADQYLSNKVTVNSVVTTSSYMTIDVIQSGGQDLTVFIVYREA